MIDNVCCLTADNYKLSLV